jgi:hypothetical protein
MNISITQDSINIALGDLLKAMLPQLRPGKIVVGQVNRVPAPEGDFIVMWPLRRPRLGTNLDTMADAEFEGSIDGDQMTITDVIRGVMNIDATVFGVGIAIGTTVSEQISGTPGGVGVYAVTPAQDVAATIISAGQAIVMQPTEVVVQIDVHGPASAENAQTISTLFRDPFAVEHLEGTGLSPLYADDPRQMPFNTAAVQYEDRWIVEAHLQVDPTVAVSQEFASSLTIDLYNVDFPPSP